MADLVIRGMEMPTVCIDNGWYGNCPMDRSWCAQRFAPKDSTNESAHKDQWNKLPSWCPLVPLPEGHGKLIDIKDVKSGKFHIEGRAEMYSAYNTGWNDALDAVCMNAPSIVPAEGGTDDGD